MKANRPDRGEPEVFVCPTCGALVEQGAHSCPECGSDDRTGWSEEARRGGADIPTGYGDDDFDYAEFVEREFGAKGGVGWRLSVRGWLAVAAAAVLCLLLLLLLLGG